MRKEYLSRTVIEVEERRKLVEKCQLIDNITIGRCYCHGKDDSISLALCLEADIPMKVLLIL